MSAAMSRTCFFAADPWFRGIDLSYGPDGGVFVLDWSDTGECHEHDGVHRVLGPDLQGLPMASPPAVAVRDLSPLKERELVALHATRTNGSSVRRGGSWQSVRAVASRSATRSRACASSSSTMTPNRSRKIPRPVFAFRDRRDRRPYLRGLLRHEQESVRTWAVRLLTDALPIDTIYSRRGGPDVDVPADLLRELAALARNDPSALVRLALASTLQRLPVNQRFELAEALLSRSEDDADHNLPSLIWTGLVHVAESNPDALVRLALACRIPNVLRLITRRLGEDLETRPGPVNSLLAEGASRPEEFRAQVVAGLSDALAGWRKAAKPAAWDRFLQGCSTSNDPTMRVRIRDLNVLFGDGRAIEEVTRLALDDSASVEVRKAALKALIETGRPTSA